MRLLLGLCAVLTAATAVAGCGSGPRPDVPRFDLAGLPMRFEPTTGGLVARGQGYELALRPGGTRLSLAGLDEPLRTTFAGARVEPTGEGRLPGRTNYLVGDRSQWRIGVRGFARAVYEDVWPGIDVAYRGDGRHLRYDYRLAPGADPRRIAVDYAGADLRPARNGDLLVGDVLRERAPRAFQDGRRIASRFVVRGDRVGVAVGEYDRTRPLLIDPTISFGTFLGGAGVDGAAEAAVDADGNIYVVGVAAAGFPTRSALQSTTGGGQDGFVTKLAPDGKSLVFSTFIGGDAADTATGIAIGTEDDAPVAFVGGVTKSSDFPATEGSAQQIDPSDGSDFDSWIAKLETDGSDLVWATHVGGDGDDTLSSLAVNESGEAWAAGTTESGSLSFPTSGGAADVNRDGPSDGFLVRMSADGAAFGSAGFVGGDEEDSLGGLALDSDQNPVVAGRSDSPDLPGTANTAQPALAGPFGDPPFDFYAADAFVTRLGANGATIADTSYLGGKNSDYGAAVALDEDDNVYVTGGTVSADFPATAGAYQEERGNASDGGDAFAAKLSPDLAALTYATYLGGNGLDAPDAIAVDEDGNAHVGGYTWSTNWPVTDDAIQSTKGASDGTLFGPQDGAYSVLNADGDDLVTSTYLGGTGFDGGLHGIAIGADGTVALVGETYASDFPGIDRGYQDVHGGQNDAVVLVAPGRRPTSVSVACAPPSVELGQTTTCTATVRDTGAAPAQVPAGAVAWSANGPGSFSGDCALASGTCSATLTPEAAGPPASVVTARYRGDATHSASSGTTSVTVTDPPAGPSPATPGGAPGPSPTVPPAPADVNGLNLSPARFRAAARGPSATASAGSTGSYTLTTAATVTFTVERARSGRWDGGKCKKPSRKLRKKKRCTRYTRLRGSFALAGRAGANRFRFTGRLRNRKLKPGRYRLRASAPGGASTARFKIVR